MKLAQFEGSSYIEFEKEVVSFVLCSSTSSVSVSG